jgi:hypothetical protein
MMRKYTDYILIAAFVLLCAAMPAAGMILRMTGDSSASANEENRQLAAFPEVEKLSDLETFPAGFSDYFSDHLFFKEQLVGLKTAAELRLFGELESEKVIAGTKKPWLFNRSEDGQPLQTYKRTNSFREEELQEIAENLEALRMDLEDAGMDFVLMISPDKEQIYGADYMPSYVRVTDNPQRTEQLIAYLAENAPDIRVVYPKEALLAERENYTVPLYYESDTHWNQVGAGVACSELLQTVAEIKQLDYEASKIRWDGQEHKRGDLQKMVKLGENYDSTEYLAVMQGTSEAQEVTTDPNDEVIREKNHSTAQDALPLKLYLTGDSFRWNLSPFLKEQVQDSVITSRYYFDTEDLVMEEPEVFVYMIAERYLHELTTIPGYNTMALQLKE